MPIGRAAGGWERGLIVRTRTLGEIVQDTAAIFQKRLVPFLIISAIGAIPSGIIALLVAGMSGGTQQLSGSDSLTAGDMAIFTTMMASLVALIPLAIAAGVVSVVANMALVYATSEQVQRDAVDPQQAWMTALGKFWAMFVTSLFMGLLIVLMAITIIGIPFAVYYSVKWGFVPQAIVLEGRSLRDAMSRSSDLVKGQWWRVLGIMIVVGIISAVLGGILNSILGLLPIVGIIVAQALIAPVVPIAQTLLYFDLKTRHDGATVAADGGLQPGLATS